MLFVEGERFNIERFYQSMLAPRPLPRPSLLAGCSLRSIQSVDRTELHTWRSICALIPSTPPTSLAWAGCVRSRPIQCRPRGNSLVPSNPVSQWPACLRTLRRSSIISEPTPRIKTPPPISCSRQRCLAAQTRLADWQANRAGSRVRPKSWNSNLRWTFNFSKRPTPGSTCSMSARCRSSQRSPVRTWASNPRSGSNWWTDQLGYAYQSNVPETKPTYTDFVTTDDLGLSSLLFRRGYIGPNDRRPAADRIDPGRRSGLVARHFDR